MRLCPWLVAAMLSGSILAGPSQAEAQRSRASVPQAKKAPECGTTLRTLSRGKVVAREAIPLGRNKPKFVTLLGRKGDRVKAVFKARDNEIEMRSNIATGTLHLREVAAYRVARAMNLRLVPPTITRSIDGKVGSLQLFVEGKHSREKGKKGDRVALEKLRVFDYVIGNSDRSSDNILYREVEGKVFPVGIDNGVSFPVGQPEMIFPYGASEHPGPLTAETRAFIETIQPKKIARVLARGGIERTAIVTTLRRLERVKKDPSFLTQPQAGDGPMVTLSKMMKEAQSETQGLSKHVLARIDRIADDALGRLERSAP